MQVELNFKDIQLLLEAIDSLTFNLVKLEYSKEVKLSDDRLSDIINDKLVLQSLRSKLNDAINR